MSSKRRVRDAGTASRCVPDAVQSRVKVPVRLACLAMRVGDPVQVTENGRIITATIAESIYGAM
jgi:hypothetical protein